MTIRSKNVDEKCRRSYLFQNLEQKLKKEKERNRSEKKKYKSNPKKIYTSCFFILSVFEVNQQFRSCVGRIIRPASEMFLKVVRT